MMQLLGVVTSYICSRSVTGGSMNVWVIAMLTLEFSNNRHMQRSCTIRTATCCIPRGHRLQQQALTKYRWIRRQLRCKSECPQCEAKPVRTWEVTTIQRSKRWMSWMTISEWLRTNNHRRPRWKVFLPCLFTSFYATSSGVPFYLMDYPQK